MLASDVANKEFEGAVPNPDEILHVEFYWHEPIDKWESEKIGKIVKLPKLPFVRYMRPGDPLSIMEVPVQDIHKARWPQKWLAWQIREGLIEGEHKSFGWPVEEWAELTENQVHELKYLRFTTVEQIAGASDAAITRIGMGGLALREKAKAALRNRMGVEVKEELAAKDKELQEMRERMAKLEAAILAVPVAAPSETIVQKPKRKYTKRQEQVSG